MNATTSKLIYDARRASADGRFHAAATILLEVFRHNPSDPAIALELGIVMRIAGDPASALEYLTRAYCADPANAQIVAELVLTYHDLGSHTEASQILIRSLNHGLQGDDLSAYLSQAA
ncbi:MAG: tetratricopeptide repeat protein [Planctomycetes bacterium]|nr:tetratricopeptide repeat protein [Planctomycetota bacterium]